MEETLLTIPYNNSVVLTSIVNGLIATCILWVFWTPFIVFLVVPLVNAQINNQLCEFGRRFNLQTIASDILGTMRSERKITDQQYHTAINWIATHAVPPKDSLIPELNIMSTDEGRITEINKTLMIAFGFTAIVIVSLCAFLVGWLINRYNLNGPHILKFNLIMAFVIVMIEMGFFGTVAMQYVPFDPPKILESLVQKIATYLN